jgi:putative glutamine amidotransferase
MAGPLIAVTGRPVAAGRITNWRQGALAVPMPYLDAVARGGGVPAVLRPEPLDVDGASGVLRSFGGLVLTGGGDVDPVRYGEEAAPEVYGVDGVTDTFELALLDAAIARGLPVLAICRGVQVLNVARGGTLDQHITGRTGLEAHGVPGVSGSTHTVSVQPGTRLWEAMETSTAVAACHHHQAIGRVGDGLRVVARCADGIIEALELDDAGFVVGVQWHPEDTAADDPAQQRLFDTFVARAGLPSRFAG